MVFNSQRYFWIYGNKEPMLIPPFAQKRHRRFVSALFPLVLIDDEMAIVPLIAATLTRQGLSQSILRIFFLIGLLMLTVLMVNERRHFHVGVFRTLALFVGILDVDGVIR